MPVESGSMTAKEKLLERVTRLSESEADETLRLLDNRNEGSPDEWGDLSDFVRASSASVFKHLDEEEAKAGFSWEEHR
jgi:hypothetical protein